MCVDAGRCDCEPVPELLEGGDTSGRYRVIDAGFWGIAWFGRG
jgi:hypothetical protein